MITQAELTAMSFYGGTVSYNKLRIRTRMARRWQEYDNFLAVHWNNDTNEYDCFGSLIAANRLYRYAQHISKVYDSCAK